MSLLTSTLVLSLALAGGVGPSDQQAQASERPRPSAEGTELTNGWALFTEGKMEQALVRADRVLATNPGSVAAFVLAIEAELARGRSAAALTRYEAWIGARQLEEPSFLRRIAKGVLRELAGANPNPARLDALDALAQEGDAEAIVTLHQGVKTSNLAEARVLARKGDEAAVKVLVDDLKRTGGRSMPAVEALGESGSSLAVAALADLLAHGFPEIRGSAVEGLGKLGAKHKTAARIKPLLNDPVSFVRLKAAAALLALGDVSGLPMLQELAGQENPSGRLMAIQAMASQPGPEWQAQVRQLLSADAPEVRVGAARLLLPHQPEVARPILEAAMNDQNPAIREMASETFVEGLLVTDLPALRRMLKTADLVVRARAAGRILELLR